MGDELTTDQEVIGRAVTKGVAHMPVPARKPATVPNELEQPVFLRLGHIAKLCLVA